jgi:hypothetical protein
MDFSLKYHFNAAEREAYQKSTHCQNVTNHSSITSQFKMQGNTMHSTSYQQVMQYICLQIAQREVPEPTVGQHHFTVITGSLHTSF